MSDVLLLKLEVRCSSVRKGASYLLEKTQVKDKQVVTEGKARLTVTDLHKAVIAGKKPQVISVVALCHEGKESENIAKNALFNKARAIAEDRMHKAMIMMKEIEDGSKKECS